MQHDTVARKARLQVEVLDAAYDVAAKMPGVTLTELAIEALSEWLVDIEGEELDMTWKGQHIYKAPGDPYPDSPNDLRTGRPPRGGRERGPVRVTTLHLPVGLDARVRNAVAWTPDLYLSWAIEDAITAWTQKNS